jgi:hypothetical protein
MRAWWPAAQKRPARSPTNGLDTSRRCRHVVGERVPWCRHRVALVPARGQVTDHPRGDTLPRLKGEALARSHYSYEKRRKELEKIKKKEEKRRRKLERKAAAAAESSEPEGADDADDAGDADDADDPDDPDGAVGPDGPDDPAEPVDSREGGPEEQP